MTSSLTVLIVEDDFLIRTCLAEYLEDNGLTVREAGTCAEARAYLSSDAPLHALITDMALPDGDGMAVSHRARNQCPSLPIIYISGNGELRRAETSDDPLFDRFISKPYTLANILKALQEMTQTVTG